VSGVRIESGTSALYFGDELTGTGSAARVDVASEAPSAKPSPSFASCVLIAGLRWRDEISTLITIVADQFTRLSAGGNHSLFLTVSFGTYVRMFKKNGLPSGAGNQFDSGTSGRGARANRIRNEPSAPALRPE